MGGKRRPLVPPEYKFRHEHMEHLQVLVKLLERARNGMPQKDVDLMADSMRRLRDSIGDTATPGAGPYGAEEPY
jgi:hypothetical protein